MYLCGSIGEAPEIASYEIGLTLTFFGGILLRFDRR